MYRRERLCLSIWGGRIRLYGDRGERSWMDGRQGMWTRLRGMILTRSAV
jgi:hypothetical protein